MKNSTRNFFHLGILLSFCHLILTVVSLVVSFALGAPRFDQPDLPVSAVEEVGTFIFSIFSQPMMFIVDTFHLSPNGTILEWSLFFLNSSLWGFCLTLLFSLLRSLLFSHAEPAAEAALARGVTEAAFRCGRNVRLEPSGGGLA